MAAGGFKEFVAGETLDQDEINDFLMQGMLVFAGTAARGSAITAPVEGQFTYLADSDTVEFYDSTQWVPLASGVGAAVVSGTTGSPTVTSGTSIGGTAYDIYEFTGDGSITFSDPGLIDLLVVGGGSGGAGITTIDQSGGGGGAGGFTEINSYYVTAGTVTVAIGAGAAGGVYEDKSISEGSSFGDLNSVGGGYGMGILRSGFDRGGDGASGGGGGGAGSSGTMPGGNAVAQTNGNDGGSGFGSSSTNRAAGGGGGAGAAGSNAASSVGGNGGAGVSSSITGSSVFYSGGGGGGARTGTAGLGGSSIGGNGGLDLAGSNASPANRGSGGGGAGGSSNKAGGNGSSGVVIVRVAV